MNVKKIGVVSLSSGILGESYVQHEVKIGEARIRDYGVELVALPHAQKGIGFIQEQPKARAQDLLEAFQDDSIDMILCAIGGEDTYRLLPYLFDHDELQKAVTQKIFLGFSDTTINHFMLHKVGIKSYYGQAFLPDICELSNEMLPYSQKYFEELITTGEIKEIRPSDVWYREREDFTENAIGIDMESYPNSGFELLQGKAVFSGQVLGGCIESIYNMFDGSRFTDSPSLCAKYQLFPQLEDWRNKILLLETSEEMPTPDLFRKMIQAIENTGIFNVLSGVLVGKPMNEVYYDDYKIILLEELSNKDLSIVYNISVGHATPRCIIPFGVAVEVNVEEQVIRIRN